MRGLVIAIALCVTLVGPAAAQTNFIGADTPEPDGAEMVGILYGKTYTFHDLGKSRAELQQEMTASTPPGAHVMTPLLSADAMRSGAAIKFRKMVLSQSIARLLPKCDLTVSQAEIGEFVGWWKMKLAEYESTHASERLPGGRTVKTSVELALGIPGVTDIASSEIHDWKERACVYRAYGGGHIQRAYQAGPTDRFALFVADFPFPSTLRHPGIPHDAYRAHFAKLTAAGDLSIPDKRYADSFSFPDKDDGIEFYSDAVGANAILIPYWRAGALGSVLLP